MISVLRLYHRSINALMLDQMWQHLEDGVDEIKKENIDANAMDKEEFDAKNGGHNAVSITKRGSRKMSE